MLTFSYKYIIVISLYSICNIGYLFFILWFYYKDFYYYYYYYLEGAFFFIADNKQMVHFAMYLNISFAGHRFHFLRDPIELLVSSICFIVLFSW